MKKSIAPSKQNGHGDGNIHDPSRALILHHLESFQDNDLEDLMSDYTNESVLITEEAVFTGVREIRTFFVGLMPHFPKQAAAFELDQLTVKDEMAFIRWHAKTPTLDVTLGSDTFILKDGKIHRQTFVGQLTFAG